MVSARGFFAPSDRMRFVALGGSIVSDWENPVATSARAVLSALAKSGHEVTFLEQRGNPNLTALLANRGSRAYKAFPERYPGIQLRTYDLPRGWQRTVWFGGAIGAADVVIALPGASPELLSEIAALSSPRIATLVDESFGVGAGGLRLVRAGNELDELDVPFGPAVELGGEAPGERSNCPLLVAYDDPDEAQRVAESLATSEKIVTGSAILPGWTYVPEFELPDWYARHGAAIVIGAGDGAWAEARRLMPIASGCTNGAPVPEAYTADRQATALVTRVLAQLGREHPR